ncbi:MAG: CDP-glycerol glycerophosphotransferase family protein [Chlamydiales bacterium]|nr:CDP-glycerol glycerophosphotransferase family protein [Chlamydiales bacterium]
MEAAGIVYATSAHHLDHIAPLCLLLDLPLIVTDPAIYVQATAYYPQLIIHEVDELHLIDFIAKRFSVLISCLPACLLSKIFLTLEHLYGKKITSIWCPHGSSDKGYHFAGKIGLQEERYAFIYGQKMRDFFREKNIFPNLRETISVGNYRHSYYTNVKPLYMGIFDSKIQSQFSEKKPLILYAPTWNDEFQSHSILEIAPDLIENLPNNYNLLIKIHPNVSIQQSLQIERMIDTYQHRPNIGFLTDFPLIYPILDQTSIYVGDRSSIGYDFLTYNRPMLFIDASANHPLNRCGITIHPDSIDEFYDILQDHLLEDPAPFEQVRSDLCAYTFDPLSDKATIKSSFNKLLHFS